MILVVSNELGRRIWLTLRYDAYKDVIHVRLYPKQPPLSPRVELYENLHDGQYMRLSKPEWADSTRVAFDDAALDPKPKYHGKEMESDDGIIRIFSLKLTNGAS